MQSSELRQRFLDFFNDNNHEILSSDPLLAADPDLLFNIAGMVPFKPYFLGEENPPSKQIATAQKCLRTEDIDQVGETARHLTFFEMLGNFSFGDYFKQSAVEYSWEFLVEELKLDPERLWITVFGGHEDTNLKPDREAQSIWQSVDGVKDDRVLRLGKQENFWEMGPTGPCGPCSEILYDQASSPAHPDEVKEMILAGQDRILELWNLVFMEFQREDVGGELQPLPEKNIDTGLGLERLAAIMQGVESNFGTDLFAPLINTLKQLTGKEMDDPRNRNRSRVIADHVRASSFLLAEGLLPGNEGRGYVLRRLIRRAHLRGRRLGLREPFLVELVPTVIDIMGDHFKELDENRNEIEKGLRREEEQFERILDRGLDELDNRIDDLREHEETAMSGGEIFNLYETHGLPVEMTKDVLDDRNIEYNDNEVEEARKEHEQTSRSGEEVQGTHSFDFAGIPETEFTGYDELEREAEVTGLYQGKDHVRVDEITFPEAPSQTHHHLVLDASPFYSEGGGQSGDRGWIEDKSIKIADTVERNGRYLHRLEVDPQARKGIAKLEVGETVRVQVDETFRRGNMRHHTATHLLHHALRWELGDQVIQDGSSLDDQSLRFDFTYNAAVDPKTLDDLEQRINDWIYREIPVESEVMDRKEAEENGALAFFGEHYGREVRVVSIVDREEGGPESKEFCGGTHLDNTEELGVFTITNETAVASGVRRIEAKAGKPAYEHLKAEQHLLREASGAAGLQQTDRLPQRIREIRETLTEKEDELEHLRQIQTTNQAEKLVDSAEDIEGVSVVVERFEGVSTNILKSMVDEVRKRVDSGSVLLISKIDNNVRLVMGVTRDLTDEVDAGEWIEDLGSTVGGGGGGRPELAEAGGSRTEGIGDVVDQFRSKIQETFGKAAWH